MVKKKNYILFLLVFLMIICKGHFVNADGILNSKIILSEYWKFSKGDNPDWAKNIPIEAAPIEINKKWEDCGYPEYDGFAWYFIEFSLPEIMLNKELVIYLGKIDDADETYLNGEMIGRSGSMTSNFRSEWNVDRYYPASAHLLKKENKLAVRVYDAGYGGGMHKGVPMIMTKESYDKIMQERFKPHRSFNQIPFANGLTSSKLNLDKNLIDSFREHIYNQYDENTKTRDFGKEIYFSLDDKPPKIEEAYLSDGILKYLVVIDGIKINCSVFTPMTQNEKKLYFIVEHQGKLESGRFTAQMMISGKDEYSGSGNKFVQRSGNDYIVMTLFSEKGRPDAFWYNGSMIIKNMSQLGNYVGLSITYRRDGDTDVIENHVPSELIRIEEEWWNNWHKSENGIAAVSGREKLFSIASSVLKMAQCREDGRSFGQILASLPPGQWNIAWIRDGAYAINALVLSNHLEEAKAGLTFYLEAEAGKFKNFTANGRDFGVGIPYRISVCRYFGNGTEESDGGDDPNIELDGFGLFLWALENYIKKSDDVNFLQKYEKRIFDEIADVIIHCIEPESGIIRDESGPWERHIIDNGYNGTKHFSYTSATAYRGLLAASYLAEKLGRIEDAKKYSVEAEKLKTAFNKQFVVDGYIKGVIEETEITKCLDAGAVEAINFDIVDYEVGKRTLEVFDKYLKRPFTPGYSRNDDGGDYDVAEWIVIDLRIASAFIKLSRLNKGEVSNELETRASDIINWIEEQAKLNHYIIPELFSIDSADYDGAIPMCGFGAGAYIMAVME